MALRDVYYVTGCPLLPRANLTRHQSKSDSVRPQNNDTHSPSLVGLGSGRHHDRGELLPSPKKPKLSRRDYRCPKERKREGKSGIEMLLDEVTSMRRELKVGRNLSFSDLEKSSLITSS